MTDPSKHADDRGWIEKIMLMVPGFSGYLKKEYRRESDHLVRTAMALRLEKGKADLDAYLRKVVDAGGIDALAAGERVRGGCDRLINRFKGAVRGYSGFFDYVAVRENTLDEVYQHDLGVLNAVDALAQYLAQLGTSGDPSQASKLLEDCLTQINDVETRFSKRHEMLEGIAR
jgi:hypothetical protein